MKTRPTDEAIQLVDDLSQGYPLDMSIFRAIPIAFESWVIDSTSTFLGLTWGGPAGEIIMPTGGGIVGYGLVAYGTSMILEAGCRYKINPFIYPMFGLGRYP